MVPAGEADAAKLARWLDSGRAPATVKATEPTSAATPSQFTIVLSLRGGATLTLIGDGVFPLGTIVSPFGVPVPGGAAGDASSSALRGAGGGAGEAAISNPVLLRSLDGSASVHPSDSSSNPGPASPAFDVAATFRGAGLSAGPAVIDTLIQLTQQEQLPLESATRVAVELFRRGIPPRADLLRAGIHWQDLSAREIPDLKPLEAWVERSLPVGSDRQLILDALSSLRSSENRTTPISSSVWAARLGDLLARIVDLVGRDDPLLAGIDRALSAIGTGGSQALAETLSGSLGSVGELAAREWKDLPIGLRATAREILTRLESQALRGNEHFREFQGLARDLHSFVEGQKFVSYLEQHPSPNLGTLLASGLSTWRTPDGDVPFRYRVVDRRGDHEDDERLGFSLDFESRTLGEVRVQGKWARTAMPNSTIVNSASVNTSAGGNLSDSDDLMSGRLDIRFRAKEEATQQSIVAALPRLDDALRKDGYQATSGVERWIEDPSPVPTSLSTQKAETPGHRSQHVVAGAPPRLDLEA